MDQSRKQLRKAMREKRRNLPIAEQTRLADRLAAHFSSHSLFRNSQRIAFYISNDGELDLLPLIVLALARKKRCYLPVLGAGSRPHLRFAPYRPGIKMRFNKFGIPEPQCFKREMAKPLAMDLVLTPLVAFDESGNRIGMGGGYYDRTFAFLRFRRRWSKPRLIGVAHDFQKVNRIQNESWDVPLSGVVTPSSVLAF
ncbi:MAG: 5-formyltetrahydrofolate cyclo-ligase [Gammaproteobacteria bacterium]|nr:5-formyltetrahydrofolate cyclo-ligase [Gammaproteobacteria bacterium]MDH5803288.1 5-formyltetrahydrofolate cyclo-ligase [Gammaproteobacteria bacterium]